MLKFELEQIIYYMRDNRPHNAPVLARMYVENAHDDWTCNQEQIDLFTPFGPSGSVYKTCHGIVRENEAFASKREMLEAMLGEDDK